MELRLSDGLETSRLAGDEVIAPDPDPDVDRRHRNQQVTAQQISDFLERVAAGDSTKVAAREVGSTGRIFRALRSPHAVNYDPDFYDAFEKAEEAGRGAYRDKLRSEIRDRAFDREDSASAGFLKMEAEALLEEYEHRRVRHTRLGQDSPFQIQAVLPTVSQEVLDAMPIEELEELIGKLRALQSASEPAQLRAIEGGSA